MTLARYQHTEGRLYSRASFRQPPRHLSAPEDGIYGNMKAERDAAADGSRQLLLAYARYFERHHAGDRA